MARKYSFPEDATSAVVFDQPYLYHTLPQGGNLDKDGFLNFPNGAFIAPDGLFFNSLGYDRYGGMLDSYGNYQRHDPKTIKGHPDAPPHWEDAGAEGDYQPEETKEGEVPREYQDYEDFAGGFAEEGGEGEEEVFAGGYREGTHKFRKKGEASSGTGGYQGGQRQGRGGDYYKGGDYPHAHKGGYKGGESKPAAPAVSSGPGKTKVNASAPVVKKEASKMKNEKMTEDDWSF